MRARPSSACVFLAMLWSFGCQKTRRRPAQLHRDGGRPPVEAGRPAVFGERCGGSAGGLPPLRATDDWVEVAPADDGFPFRLRLPPRWTWEVAYPDQPYQIFFHANRERPDPDRGAFDLSISRKLPGDVSMVAREADSGAPISLAGQAATEWCARDGDAISMVYVVHLGAEAVTIQYLVKPGDTEAAQVLRTLEWTEQ